MFKKIIFAVLLVLVSLLSYAQPSQYTPMTAAGYQFKRILTDSTLHLPSFCGVPNLRNSTAKNGALAIDTCNYKLYQWTNGNGWKVINIDTTSLSNRINNRIDSLKRSNDSVYARKNNQWVFQYKDSTGGGTTPTLQQVLNSGNSAMQSLGAYGMSLSDNSGYTLSLNSTGLQSTNGNDYSYGYYGPANFFLNDGSSQNMTGGVADNGSFLDVSNVYGNKINLTSEITSNIPYLSWFNNQDGITQKLLPQYSLANSDIYMPYRNPSDTLATLSDLRDINVQNGRFGNDTATVVMAKVHNNSGTTLTNGKVVFLATSGTNSDAPSVRLANNKNDSTSANTFGFVTGSIANNDTGYVILSGKIEKLNTSAFANGDIIYLDSTSGNWTKTKPIAPYHMVYLGVVVKANAGNGAIFVKCQNGYELDEIHDVQISNKLNNQVLAYSDTQQLWKNRNIYSIVDTTTTVATKSNIALKLNISDTATMLSKYLRKSDTTSLSNRINLKLNISDTAAMLSSYLRSNTASATYLAKSDSTIYYTKYRSDTSRTNIYNAINGKVNISDTASMLNPYLRKADTVSLSNRINLKLNISDTASMLNPYLRKIDTTNKFVNTITRTAGKDSIIFYIGGTRYAIKDSTGGGGTTYTFSTGLTNSSGTITNNLSTGISGGQSVVGGTAASNSLTLSSTSNATKGKILFGTSAYDEVNNRLGIGTASPSYPLHLTTSITAASKFAVGAYVNNTLVASANNDTLVGLQINPTYSNGAFTGVSNVGLRIDKAFSFGYASSGTGEIKALSTNGAVDFLGAANNTGSFNFYGGGAYDAGSGITVRGNSHPNGATINFWRNGFIQNGQFTSAGNLILGTSTTDAGYKLDVNGTARVQGALNFNPTNTAAGTTGNQTINKASGTVNIAAAGTTITVTNSLVTTSSIVFAVLRTNDATATIKNVVPSAGSFTINLTAAATTETSIGFFVIN